MIAFRMITLIGVFIFGLPIVLSNEAIAAPSTRLPTSALPAQIGEQFDVVEVRNRRNVRRHRSRHRSSYGRVHRRNSYQGPRHVRRYVRPRHHRARPQRRYRRHPHSYGRIWYSPQILFSTPIYVIPRYNQCDKWRRLCQRNWGLGANYRGCLKYHRCR
jgi:hypothetical protein